METTNSNPSAIKAVDLGLSTKWADRNIGATNPEDHGEYYAWGETEEKWEFSWYSYKRCDHRIGLCNDLGASISQTKYDVARIKWGDKWQMPTREQMKELIDNCTVKWTTVNGVSGLEVTGPNGNSIFLPAAGYNFDCDIYDLSTKGCYWLGAQGTKEEDGDYANAYSFEFSIDYASEVPHSRYLGLTVRPVSAE